MKKAKTIEVKLRSAIRLIWSRSAERRAIIKAATCDCAMLEYKHFHCPVCSQPWAIQMAEVDHEPPLGPLTDYMLTGSFIHRMFFGPQRAIDKLCHKKKTAEQRRKKC